MSPPTPFQKLIGTARHELELAIFEGIIDQGDCCGDCKWNLTARLKEVKQIHNRRPLMTTALETLEIFDYDSKDRVIRRHKLAGEQHADHFTRPTVTCFSVAKALYLDIDGSMSVQADPSLQGVPMWHEAVLTQWVNSMRTLSTGQLEEPGKSGSWVDRFLFEVLLFEYRNFFKVGDSTHLFVNSPAVPSGVVGEDKGGLVQKLQRTLNESSCEMMVSAYWSRVKTFHLPTHQNGIKICRCKDYQEFQDRMSKASPDAWNFEKIFRTMFLGVLGATKAMTRGGLDFRGSDHGSHWARMRQKAVGNLTQDLGHAMAQSNGDRWLGIFESMSLAGREVKENKFADEAFPEPGPRWRLDEEGKLRRCG